MLPFSPILHVRLLVVLMFMWLGLLQTQIDLSPVLTPLIQIGGLILSGLASWVAVRIAVYFHISTQNTALQMVLGAVDRGIGYGETVVAQRGITSANNAANAAVRSEVAREAVNYVVTKLPDTLKTLGMTNQHVADLVTAKLPAPIPPV